MVPTMEVSLGWSPLISSPSPPPDRGALISKGKSLCGDVIPRPPHADNKMQFERSLVKSELRNHRRAVRAPRGYSSLIP